MRFHLLQRPDRLLTLGVLVLGAALAVYAVRGVQAHVATIEAASITNVPLVERHVFARDLERGHVVTPDDLVLAPFAASTAPTTIDATGKFLAVPVDAGWPVLEPLVDDVKPSVVLRRAGIAIVGVSK